MLIILSTVLIQSCSNSTKADAIKSTVTSDTLVISMPSAVYYDPDSVRIQSSIAKVGEDDFYAGADDYSYYLNQSIEYLKKTSIPIIHASDNKYLKFVSPGSYSLIKIDTLDELWGIIFFSPGISPRRVELLDIDSEYRTYFKEQKSEE